jgi:hypothetical protein
MAEPNGQDYENGRVWVALAVQRGLIQNAKTTDTEAGWEQLLLTAYIAGVRAVRAGEER